MWQDRNQNNETCSFTHVGRVVAVEFAIFKIKLDGTTGCLKKVHNFVQVLLNFENRYMNKLCLV